MVTYVTRVCDVLVKCVKHRNFWAKLAMLGIYCAGSAKQVLHAGVRLFVDIFAVRDE